MKQFEDDEPVQCDVCGEMIYAGDEYLTYQGLICCDNEECMKELLYEQHEDEFVRHYLYTAQDYEADYADIKYEEYKDECLTNQMKS